MSANSSECVSFTESAAYKHSTQPELLFVVTVLELLVIMCSALKSNTALTAPPTGGHVTALVARTIGFDQKNKTCMEKN